MEVEPAAGLPPEWYEQETIRGDFLRAIRQFEMNQAEPLGLETYLSEAHLAGALAVGRRAGRPGGPPGRAPRGGLAGRRSAQRGGSAIVKITALEIDGYGVWSGLKIERLADGLERALRAERGRQDDAACIRPLGALRLLARAAALPAPAPRRPARRLDRSGRPQRPLPDRPPRRRRTASPAARSSSSTAADGTRQGEHLLKVLLSNIDEPIFNNVFAVGLREMQELGTLSDTDAAELLYNLSAGWTASRWSR